MKVEEIISEVCARMECTIDELQSLDRHRRLADARGVICYLLSEAGMSHASIGLILHRERESVRERVRSMRYWMLTPKTPAPLPIAVARDMKPRVGKVELNDVVADVDHNWRYSADEIQMLRELYPTTQTDVLAVMMGRSRNSITVRANKLGLKKTRKCRGIVSRESYATAAERKEFKVKKEMMDVAAAIKEAPEPPALKPKPEPKPKPKRVAVVRVQPKAKQRWSEFGKSCIRCEFYPHCFKGIENLESDFGHEGCHGYKEKELKRLNA